MKEEKKLNGYKFAERIIVVVAMVIFLFYMINAQIEHKIFFRESACNLCEDNTDRVCISERPDYNTNYGDQDYWGDPVDVGDLI